MNSEMFNQITEHAPGVTKHIADNLGVTVWELRQLVRERAISIVNREVKTIPSKIPFVLLLKAFNQLPDARSWVKKYGRPTPYETMLPQRREVRAYADPTRHEPPRVVMFMPMRNIESDGYQWEMM